MVDVLKCHLLGEVEYAQHNFARLRPLLYSLDGRSWAGPAERSWFPDAGLVFSLAPDLRFAPSGSLWTFQIKPNERLVAGEGKDVFMTIQVKPAARFMTELEPMAPEWLRILATVTGFDPRSSTGGILLPEVDDRWVLVPECERGDDGLARVTNDRLLPHMRALEGTPEEIAGMATPDGRWVLPVINSGHGTEIRNWSPPAVLAQQIAADLRRWLPHAPHREKAAAAAQALREVAPHLTGISALRSIEVKAALSRVTDLAEDAEALTESVDSLVKALLSAPAIAREMEAEKAEMRRELEAQALESAERLEAEARERLLREQAEVSESLQRDREALMEVRGEIEAATGELEAVRKQHRAETTQFTKSLEALIARARTEPAAYAAEWLGRLGLRPGVDSPRTNAGLSAAVEPAVSVDGVPERVADGDLGRILSRVSPIRNDGLPRFLLMDAAIRARELVVGIGPGAREAIESWFVEMVSLTAIIGAADPSILSFAELLPTGPRGTNAPLAAAIDLASRFPDRPVVGLLDDVDVAAGGFWLPQTARAARQPQANGLPSNLFLIALVEGDPNALRMTPARAGELFPLRFDDTEPTGTAADPAVRELDSALFVPPLRTNARANRVRALRNAASRTFNEQDVERLSTGFDAFLKWAKLGGPPPATDMSAGRELIAAATMITKGNDREC